MYYSLAFFCFSVLIVGSVRLLKKVIRGLLPFASGSSLLVVFRLLKKVIRGLFAICVSVLIVGSVKIAKESY
jgi:hypothetical protein